MLMATIPAMARGIERAMATYSISNGSTRRPTARVANQSGLVADSTRSPALNTGPFPAKSCSTIR